MELLDQKIVTLNKIWLILPNCQAAFATPYVLRKNVVEISIADGG